MKSKKKTKWLKEKTKGQARGRDGGGLLRRAEGKRGEEGGCGSDGSFFRFV